MIKSVWKFKGVGQSTWTETWYWSGTFQPTTEPIPAMVINQRIAFLDDQCSLRSIRYSNPDSTDRASAPFEKGLQGTYNGGTRQASQPDDAIVYTLSGVTPLASRKIYFHGLNTNQYGVSPTAGEPYITAGTRDLVNAFCNMCANSGAVIRCLVRGVTLGAGLNQILKVEPDPANAANSILTTVGNHALSVGQMALIRGASRKTAPGLNGTYTVLAKTATTMTINYTCPTSSVSFSGGAFVRANEFVQNASITSAQFHSIAGRKVKSAFFDSRGARSQQKIRHLASVPTGP